MIPKIIHYCWFGKNPKPTLTKRCIKSWKRYCPDYQIIEWNEENFDISACPLYVRQAYEAKKWAFVTDYVRLYALTQYGGIYMDTDVEVVKSLDEFLVHQAFSGFEDSKHIPTGIMACEKGNPLFLSWLHEYDDMIFIQSDGSCNMQTNVMTITNSMLTYGIRLDNSFQIIADCAFYPNDYFCPKDLLTNQIVRTKRTHTIHHFAGSWVDEEAKRRRKKVAMEIKRKNMLHYIIHFPNRLGRAVLGNEAYEKLKHKLKKG